MNEAARLIGNMDGGLWENKKGQTSKKTELPSVVQDHQLVTIDEFCNYMGLDTVLVKQLLRA